MSAFSTRARLAAVLCLLLTPIILLGWLFVRQSQKDIAFAQKEVSGIDYLRAVMPLLERLTHQDIDIPPEHLARFRAARSRHDAAMQSTVQAEHFERALLGHVHRREAVAAARGLISRIGDQSNLILDPDLDTYYLMDIVLLRIPEALVTTRSLADGVAKALGSAFPSAALSTEILVASGRLATARGGIQESIGRAFTSNADGALAASMAERSSRYLSALAMYESAAQAVTLGILPGGLSSYLSAAHVDEAQVGIVQTTMAFWELTADELERLVMLRIAGFEQRLTVALGFSAMVGLIALLIAATIFRGMLSRLDSEIVFLAHHDPLTRLKNRAAFNAELDRAIEAGRRSGRTVGLHLVDLDRFKSINDTLGHGVGDGIIRIMAERLAALCTAPHVVGRLGGDEFVVLQQDVEDEADAAALAEAIVAAMRAPFEHDGHSVRTSASLGYALAPRNAGDQVALFQCADMALYAAKAAGRDQAHAFTPELETEAKERMRIEQELRRAVEDDAFELEFQPLYDATGEELRGFEALLRLRDSDGRRIPPSDFIPIAEQLGLISHVGAWVLGAACATAARWPEHLHVAVNLSPVQFRDGAVPDLIESVLEFTGLAPGRLSVEITESTLMGDAADVRRQLERIREFGVGVALDDFGSGYSGLAYLWRYRFDRIKIDRQFVQALQAGSTCAADVMRAIVSLGHSMDMVVTAEGVETLEEARAIRDMRCDEIQGYLYGRPMPASDVAGVVLTDFRRRNGLLDDRLVRAAALDPEDAAQAAPAAMDERARA